MSRATDGSVYTGRGWKFGNYGFGTLDREHAKEGISFRSREHQSRVPHWVVLLVLSVLPAISCRHLCRNCLCQRCLRAGLCPTCGYDLRATPQRCPECGTVPATEAKA